MHLGKNITYECLLSQLVAYQVSNRHIPGHNILKLSGVLVQFRFAAGNTKPDLQYNKLGIRFASRVAKRLKTQELKKLENIRKISIQRGDMAQCPVSLPQIKLCQGQLKNTRKQILNICCPVQFYWISLFCFKHYVRDCSQ